MFQKLLLWFNTNNHPRQIFMGLIVYMCFMLIFFLLFWMLFPNGVWLLIRQIYFMAALISSVATLACGFVVEYNNKLQGNNFSWSDILATMVVPIGMSFFISIALLLSLF